MQHSALFKDMLEAGDVAGIRRLLPEAMPQFPAPTTDAEAEVTMHMARTSCPVLTFSKRAYSHAWLVERGYPSQMPDHLKPAAERIYPRVVEAVGILVKPSTPEHRPLVTAIQGAMETVVNEMFADGDRDPVMVKSRMMAARAAVLRRM